MDIEPPSVPPSTQKSAPEVVPAEQGVAEESEEDERDDEVKIRTDNTGAIDGEYNIDDIVDKSYVPLPEPSASNGDMDDLFEREKNSLIDDGDVEMADGAPAVDAEEPAMPAEVIGFADTLLEDEDFPEGVSADVEDAAAHAVGVVIEQVVQAAEGSPHY